MGYKILGYAVWRGGKWYVRRRFQGAARKAVLAGLGTVLLAGIAVAAQKQTSEK